MQTHRLAGIKVTAMRKAELLDVAARALTGKERVHLTFLNPDYARRALLDDGIRRDINSFDLVAVDGNGVRLLTPLYGFSVPERLDTDSLAPDLFRLAASLGARVFLFGCAPGVAEAAAASMTQAFPGLRVVGTEHGYHDVQRGHPGRFDEKDSEAIVEQINAARADLVVVSLPTPLQQRWTARFGHRLKAAFVLTAGSYLDHAAQGSLQRGWYPRWADRLRLNWLSRLLREPRRLWRRYTIEAAHFVLLVLRDRTRGPRRRGRSLRYVVGAALALATALGPGMPSATPTVVATAARPNVLNIVLDDMRDQTPTQVKAYLPKTVQRFAVGTFFRDADVSTPSCCPSRAAGMTGRYDHNNGMRHQGDIAKVDLTTFVQHRLRLAGYQTAMVGKYVHNWPAAQAPPDFDHYAMWIDPTYTDPTVYQAGVLSQVPGYTTTITGSRALQFLQSMAADPQQRPWYEYVAFHAPHPDDNGNFVPEPKYATSGVPACGLTQPGEADVSDKPPYASWVKVTNAQVQATCQGQMRVLKSVDDQIDRLFAYLASSGQLGRTMVLLWSDNGTLWGEHNRVGKFVPWLPAINVPMWLRWDGHVPAGTSATLVSNVDIAPTIYAATGATPPPVVLDGHSLLSPKARPYELNEYWYDYPANGKVPTWAETHDTHAAYIETYDPTTGQRDFREYYDLDADPGELTNLLGDASTADDPPAAVLAALAARLAAARTCAGSSCP